MSIFELFILAVGLSMDAFAVAVCKGLSIGKIKIRHAVTVGVWFGSFQALMPLIGYFLGTRFFSLIESFDHWVAFILLALIGANMIRECFSSKEDETDASLSAKTMLVLAVATSIDALASGIAISFLSLEKMLLAALFIGITTFSLSALGVFVGSKFGEKYKSKAEFAGGIILILLGTKILLEGLGIIFF